MDCRHCDLSIMVQRAPENLTQEFYGFIDNYEDGSHVVISIEDIGDLDDFNIPYEIVDDII